MLPQLESLVMQFELNTRLFNNVLKEVDETKATTIIAEHVNHLTWIAGHLTINRYFLASQFGVQKEFPYVQTFSDPTAPPPHNRALAPSVEYPPIAELITLWNNISPLLVDGIKNIPAEKLEEKFAFRLPTGDSFYALLSFIVSHEAYHIGQMSTIRRFLGLGPMAF